MTSPAKVKDVQCLTGCIAALNRFIARATDRSLPFFKALKKGVEFVWTYDCERSFQELKVYLGKASILSKPFQGDFDHLPSNVGSGGKHCVDQDGC